MFKVFKSIGIAAVLLAPVTMATMHARAQVTAERMLPGEAYTPGLEYWIIIALRGEGNGVTVVETPPAGWTTGRIADNGAMQGDSIVWNLASVSGSDSVRYFAAPPEESRQDAVFSGTVDGTAIGGMTVMRNLIPFRFGEAVNLGPAVNSEYEDFTPRVSYDNTVLAFGSLRPGGYGTDDIWISERSNPDAPWPEPVNAGPLVNGEGPDYYPSFSADGLTLYFMSVDREGGLGAGDIWVSTRSGPGAPWGEPVNLGENVNSSSHDAAPSVSADGLTIYFESHRPGGLGEGDIWMSTRSSPDAPWQPAVNMGNAFNSPQQDGGVYIAPDSLSIFFHSARTPMFGPDDLYVATRKSAGGEWSAPINLGPRVNTSVFEISPSVTADGSALYFSDLYAAFRPDGFGGSDIWMVPILGPRSSAPHWAELK